MLLCGVWAESPQHSILSLVIEVKCAYSVPTLEVLKIVLHSLLQPQLKPRAHLSAQPIPKLVHF